MRLFLTIVTIGLLGTAARAQSIDEISTDIYHQKYRSASSKLQAILKNDPANAEAVYLLTEVDLQKDSVQLAKELLASLPGKALEEPIVECAQGHVLMRQDSIVQAKALFDKALEQTKQKNPQVLHAIAKAHLDAKQGDANYALELIEKALKKDKDNPAILVTKGDLYRKIGNGSEAYKAYQSALAANEHYSAALFKIGKIFVSQDNKEAYVTYFDRAISGDSLYAPALYELYYYYYFKDVNKAKWYLDKYISATDKSIANEYLVTDLLFSSKKYEEAIDRAKKLVQLQTNETEPRLYKLLAYSYKEQHNTDSALKYMTTYFTKQVDTNYVAKDFEAMGAIYDSVGGKTDSAIYYYEKALAMTKDTAQLLTYYKKFAEVAKASKDNAAEAKWLGKYYRANLSATNVDLFNWGIAAFKGGDFAVADTVFTTYEQKYPEQSFGYYWAARVNAAIDSNMEQGLAIPHYLHLVELIKNDTTNAVSRKYLIEAYGYVAAYEANTKKDYANSVEYFEKLLSIDPNNEDAKKYVEVLQKRLTDGKSSKTESSTRQSHDEKL